MNPTTWFTQGYLDDFGNEIDSYVTNYQLFDHHDTQSEKRVSQSALRLWDVYLCHVDFNDR